MFKKKADKNLMETQSIQGLIIENTRDLIAITELDRHATFLYVSPSYQKILGYSQDELVGTSGMDFIHPEDKKTLLPLLKKYISMMIKGFFKKSYSQSKVNVSPPSVE